MVGKGQAADTHQSGSPEQRWDNLHCEISAWQLNDQAQRVLGGSRGKKWQKSSALDDHERLSHRSYFYLSEGPFECPRLAGPNTVVPKRKDYALTSPCV